MTFEQRFQLYNVNIADRGMARLGNIGAGSGEWYGHMITLAFPQADEYMRTIHSTGYAMYIQGDYYHRGILSQNQCKVMDIELAFDCSSSRVSTQGYYQKCTTMKQAALFTLAPLRNLQVIRRSL